MTNRRIAPLLALAGGTAIIAGLAGCESADGVEVHGSVGMYYGYGGGFYDPWYYGPGYAPPVIVNPYPPGGVRPPGSTRPPSNVPRPTPLPSARGMGGGGRRR